MTRYADGKTYLRAAEVAELFMVSPKTVTRWAQQGKLPHLRTLGGHRLYDEAEIHKLVRALQVAVESDSSDGEVTP
jgi:excisionase family DNA binding protein